MQAYEWLASEGYIETHPSVGTIVSGSLPEASLNVARSKFRSASEISRSAPKSPIVFRGEEPRFPERQPGRQVIDFWPGRPNHRHFPAQFFRKAFDHYLNFAAASLSEYGDATGLPALREAIAEQLRTARGISTTADQILVTAGIQEAINIIARLLVQGGTRVVVEDPCYQGAALTFRSFGAALVPIRIDRDGANIDDLYCEGGVIGVALRITSSDRA